MIGIIGVDVGKTSGVGWGIFNQQLRDDHGIWLALARGRDIGCAEVPLGAGPRMGMDVVSLVIAKIADWNMRGLRLDVEVEVAIEDFIVRKDLRGGTAKDKLAPVFVTGMLFGALAATNNSHMVHFITPSDSKSFANDQRLKKWARMGGVRGRAGWVKGMPHARDGWRLVATQLERTI
jgi:hypothetical protein